MTDARLKPVQDTAANIEDVAPDPAVQPPGETPDQCPPDPPTEDPQDGPAPKAEGARFPLNDTGNGRRFALYFGDDAMVVPRVGWHVWDGKRWHLDPDMIAVRAKAQQIQHRIIAEIPHLALEDWQIREIAAEAHVRAQKAALDAIDHDDRTAEQQIELEDLAQRLIWIRKLKDRRSGMKSDHRGFAKTSGNSGRVDAMLKEATVGLARDVDDLDSDPLTVNTETGILRFTVTGGGEEGYSKTAEVTLEPHARAAGVTGSNAPQFITKMMPVAHDPSGKCPLFDAVMERIQPNAEIRGFLQRWYGLSMSRLEFQGFVFLFGDGANGKSLLNELMARMMGDYASKAKIESLTGHNRRGGGDATPDLMPLLGARMAHAAEPEEGQRLQEAVIKELTGGESMLVRNLHSDFVEMKPRFKLTVSGNHKPEIRGTDLGIWRRVKLVPFDVQIPEAERDEHLGDKLWQERSGILNWLVEGLLQYLEGGLQEPAAVQAATDEYRAESDPTGTFLRECCVVDGSEPYLSARDLINGFNYWMELKGEARWERKASLRFKHNCEKYRDPATGKRYGEAKRTVTGYTGIRFTEEFRTLIGEAALDAKGRWIVPGGGRKGSDT